MAFQLTVKKWGNSKGVVFPKEIVEAKHLKINEKIFVELVKKADLTSVFASLKSKVSGQEFKDMVKKGWE